MKQVLKVVIVGLLLFAMVLTCVGCGDNSSDNVGNDIVSDCFNVYFDSDNGTEITVQQVNKGGKALKPQNPSKDSTETEAFEFIGWFIGDTQFDFTQPVFSDLILKAHYKTESFYFNVYFDSDNGTEITVQQVYKGEMAIKPQNPSKKSTATETFAFIGWFIGDTQFDFTQPVFSDLTLKAHYKTESYTIGI